MKKYIKINEEKCSEEVKCYYPCKFNYIYKELYLETNLSELKKIYDCIKDYKFDPSMKMGNVC